MLKLLFLIIILMVLCTSFASTVVCFATEEPEQVKAKKYYPISMVFENDIIGGTDEGYTNGFVMSVSEPWRKNGDTQKQGFIYDLGDKLILTGPKGREKRRTFGFGQSMMTPQDIEATEPIEDDWPYLGLLFGRITWSYQNETEADVFGILMGMVGPSSQAAETQEWVHRKTGSDIPQGWDNQIGDEFVLNLSYEHKWKLFDSLARKQVLSGLGWDITSYIGASVGNLTSEAHGGGIIRCGSAGKGANKFPATIYKGGVGSLPETGSSPTPILAYYFLIGAEGGYVFNSIMTEGNTFKGSHTLNRNPLNASVYTGIGFTFKRFRLDMSIIRGTKQFKEQDHYHKYGSATLGWIF